MLRDAQRIKTKATRRQLVTTLFAAAVLALLSAGCGGPKNVVKHRVCHTKIAKVKRDACHACLRRGPSWIFHPKKEEGSRCAEKPAPTKP